MKKVLVTGGSGFVGSFLCEELLARGYDVSAVDNFATSSRPNIEHLFKEKSFHFFEENILNEGFMDYLVKECDIIFHLAAAVGVKYILENSLHSLLTNIQGTEIVLKLADKYKKKILITSTSEVYGKHVRRAFKETDDMVIGNTGISRWSYAIAKAVDESLALAYHKEKKLAVVIVRLFNTVGPRQSSHYGMVLPKFVEEALSGKPITVFETGEQVRAFTYVTDVVKAMIGLILCKRAEGEVFNVGCGCSLTIKELAERVKAKTSSDSAISFVSYNKAFGEFAKDFQDMDFRLPDINKLKSFIKFEPECDIDEMIDKMIEFCQRKEKGKI
ncbi:MAG: GDP-mannose 4,6-dehydratase [Candidatus Omnitrophota bacterium]